MKYVISLQQIASFVNRKKIAPCRRVIAQPKVLSPVGR
jgi:hypothetical protein